MDTFQKKKWVEMINQIDEYLSKKTDYYSTTQNLENLMRASDFKDQVLIKQWYNYWIPLEIAYATRNINVEFIEIKNYMESMKKFLVDELLKNKGDVTIN